MNDVEIIRRLCEIAPAILDRNYRPDRCVAATKHAQAVLSYFGITGRPVKTQAITGNAAWRKWIEAGAVLPMPDESWSVGIDLEAHNERPGYPGHLVFVTDSLWLVDLSLGQMARPEKGIELPGAGCFKVEPDWGGENAMVYDDRAPSRLGGAVLVYRRLPEKDWDRLPDWRRSPPLAGEMIRALR